MRKLIIAAFMFVSSFGSNVMADGHSIKMGGTELLRANLATGNALPWAIIIKIKMSKCLSGNFFD